MPADLNSPGSGFESRGVYQVSEQSAVEVWVIPTNEELHIAKLSLGAVQARTQ
ncbi:MAG: hypothetical protein ACO39R_03260 [Pontimonas sp.]